MTKLTNQLYQHIRLLTPQTQRLDRMVLLGNCLIPYQTINVWSHLVTVALKLKVVQLELNKMQVRLCGRVTKQCSFCSVFLNATETSSVSN